jgi:tetratricopeptide (TPR) repeat protein
VKLWRENLARDNHHQPSRLSLARVLAEQGDEAAAVVEYTRVVKDKPEYVAAWVALGRSLAKAGRRDDGLANLREAVRLQPGNLAAWEQIGDIEKSAGRTLEAAAAYRKALELAQDGSTKKRIRRKM